MKRAAGEILKDALALPAEDRAAVAEALLASLDDDADAAWATEIQRRVAELDAGAVSTVRWPQVRRRLFERARRRALRRLRDGIDLECAPGAREELHRR